MRNSKSELKYPRSLASITHLSASSIALFERCPQSWAASYLYGMKGPEGAAAKIGKTMHSLIENNLHGLETKHEHHKIPEAERFSFEQYLAKEIEPYRGVSMHIEHEAKIPWREDAPPILMYIDWVRQCSSQDGTLVIVDHKSNRTYEPAEEWRKKIQPNIYGWGARIEWPQFPRIKFRVGYINLGTSVEFDLDAESDARTVVRLHAMWDKALEYAGSRDAIPPLENFPQEVNDGCTWCPLKKTCPSFRQTIEDLSGIWNTLEPKIYSSQHELEARYVKLVQAQKLIEREIKEAEEVIQANAIAQGGEYQAAGHKFSLSRSSSRKAEFWPIWSQINWVAIDNRDDELLKIVKEMSSELFTVKVGGLDKLFKRNKSLEKLLSPLVRKVESEKTTVNFTKID